MKRKRKNNEGDESFAIRIGVLLALIAVVIIYAITSIPTTNFRELLLDKPSETQVPEVVCTDIEQTNSSVSFTIDYTNAQGETSSQTFSFNWSNGSFTSADCGEVVRALEMGQLGIDLAQASDIISRGARDYLSQQDISLERVTDWIRKWIP